MSLSPAIKKNKVFSDYKSNRPSMEDKLKSQVEIIKSLVKEFNMGFLQID